jgi:hypothetical protein
MIRLLSATNKLIQLPDPSVFSDIKNFMQAYKPTKIADGESFGKEAVPGQPSQPIIYDMFENFPQPFENKALIDANNNTISTEKNVKKKKTKSHYKPRNIGSGGKARTSKSKNFTAKTRSKTTNSSDKKILKNNEILDESSLLTPEEIAQRDSNAFSKDNECYDNEDFEDDRSVSDIPTDNDRDDSDINENSEDHDKNKIDNHTEKLKSNEADVTHSTLILNESSTTSNTSRFNKDFVKSFEDKVFAIYSKYDNLIDQQTHKLDSRTESISLNTKKHLNTQLTELNEQKAQFSDEIARELSENVNFEEISSNPDLVKRLKELYSLVKKNGSSNTENKIKDKDDSSKKVESNHDSLKLNQPRNTSLNTGSLKTNQADIREVFSIVNSMNSKKQTKGENSTSLDEQDDLAELTIPRIKSRRNSRASQDNQIIYNGFSGVSKNATLNLTKFRLPLTLSDKINTLMENKLNMQKSKNSSLHDQNQESDESSCGINNQIKENSNIKFNYVIIFFQNFL